MNSILFIVGPRAAGGRHQGRAGGSPAHVEDLQTSHQAASRVAEHCRDAQGGTLTSRHPDSLRVR